MKAKMIFHCQPLLTLLLLGLGLGLLLTALAWGFPALADSLFSGLTWLWLLLLTSAFFALAAIWLLFLEPAGRAQPKPLYLLIVLAATALVYLFPELFAPGCGGMPRAFADNNCPPSCEIPVCTDWDEPGKNGCNPPPGALGCCVSYDTICDPNCDEEDAPPSVSGSVSCALNGSNGWCRNGAALNLTASDPQGYATTLSGDIAGAAFSCPGPTCVRSLPAGNGVIHFQATSPASGLSSAVGSASFAFDPTPPTVSLVVTGTPGANDWYTSPVVISITATDALSGVDSVEYRLDGGSWITGTSLVLGDGKHVVEARATDKAGNLSAVTIIDIQVDTTPPISGFTVPIEASTGTLAQGDYLLEGQSSDATSGLETVQISIDEGQTWLNLDVSAAGVWRYTWQTNPLENGLYPVLARAQDAAGNVSPNARVTLLLANHPPKVSVQESWWVWEAGKIRVRERFLPVTEISLRIACLGQPDVKLNFTLESLPDFFQWDRKCGEGQFATSGNHLVTLKACDQVGNCASAEGTIMIPSIPTWTPTPLPTGTATPSPTHEPRQPTPSPTHEPRQPTPSPAMTLVTTQEPTRRVPVEKPIPWLWLPAGLAGLLLAFGSSSLLDPRPAALRRLSQAWEKIKNYNIQHP